MDLARQTPRNPAPPGPETPLEEHYHYWNSQAGYNRGLLSPQPPQRDRNAPLEPPLPWKVALDSLRSGYNVGSVLRSADAFGFAGVVAGGHSPGPDHPGVKSSAMGAQNWIPYEKTDSLVDYLSHLREKENLPLVALELTPAAKSINDFEFPPRGMLVLGNEERGVSPAVLALCQTALEVPLYGRKQSLNVASAFAIAAQRLRECLNNRAK